MKLRSPAALLHFRGQVTEQTTVKWSIVHTTKMNLGLPYHWQGEGEEVMGDVVMRVQLIVSLEYWKLKILDVFS